MILPECCYLERLEPLPHFALNHRVIGGLDNPWAVTAWQKVVEPKDGAPSSFQLFAELAHRAGKDAEFIATLNAMYRVKDEYSVPMDQKLEPEAFADSVLKSVIDEEHGIEWMKGTVFTYPRKIDEVYIWANDAPERFPCIGTSCLRQRKRSKRRSPSLVFPGKPMTISRSPDWKPGCGFDVENPDYDIIPVYYTDAVNTDSWLMENPWINEINESESLWLHHRNEQRRLRRRRAWRAGTTFVSKLSRAFLSKASLRFPKAFMPRVYRLSVATGVRSLSSCLSRKDKGVPIVHLSSWARRPIAWTISAPHFDQCIRVKIEKIA